MQIKKYRNFYKNKKAIEISLTELMMALLAVAIILIIFYVGFKLSNIFLSNKDYDSTMASFDLLGERIDSLIEDENYANTNLLYFLDPYYILVGFNFKDPSIQMETCKKGIIFEDSESLVESRRIISSLCDQACLCVYKNTLGKDFDKDRKGPQMPLKCKSFDKNIVFLAPSNQENFCSVEIGWDPQAYDGYYKDDQSYKFLILKGFNTKEIYLDRYEKDDSIFIFFAEYDGSISERKKFMENKYRE